MQKDNRPVIKLGKDSQCFDQFEFLKCQQKCIFNLIFMASCGLKSTIFNHNGIFPNKPGHIQNIEFYIDMLLFRCRRTRAIYARFCEKFVLKYYTLTLSDVNGALFIIKVSTWH